MRFVHNGKLCARNVLEEDMDEEYHLHEKSCAIVVQLRFNDSKEKVVELLLFESNGRNL